MTRSIAIKTLAAATLGFAIAFAPAAFAADCDRACLKGMITKYVDAMVAHDPAQLPLAANTRPTACKFNGSATNV